MLGLAGVVILTLSVGAAFAIAVPQDQQGGSFTGMTGGLGHVGGMMGGSTANRGNMMVGQGGMMGGAFDYMMNGYANMMGSARSAMGWYVGMTSQMFQHMTGSLNHTPNGSENDRLLVISNYAFFPSSITVPKGTTVTWVNMDFVQHTVTSGTEQALTGLFDSHELSHMQSFTFTFNTSGIYSYFCDLHPDMIGTVLVTG